MAFLSFKANFSKSVSFCKLSTNKTSLTSTLFNSKSSRFFTTTQPNPPIELQTTEESPNDFTDTDNLFNHKKILLIGIVGAFTPVCQNQLGKFSEKYQDFKAKGIDEINVVSVNDAHVLKAFKKNLKLDKAIKMLADFDGSFTKSLDKEIDLTAAKLGKRSKRYAMLVDDGKVVKEWVEDKPGELKVSSAENILRELA